MSYTYAGRYSETLEDTTRKLLTSASVTVYLRGTTTKASLYTSRTKGTSLANPVPTGVAGGDGGIDIYGTLTFYADPGDSYDLSINGTTTIPVEVQVDGAEIDAKITTASGTFATKASPTFSGTITLQNSGPTTYLAALYRSLNGNDNADLILGTGQAITDQANDVYISTLTRNDTTTTGAGARGIGINIGQQKFTATDGASAITRTAQWANVEFDFLELAQTGGTAVFNNVVNSRFRFSIPDAGVTIVDNRGIDFVVPNTPAGSVTNYIAINIPALTGGGGTNFYGIMFRNTPNGGSIAAASGVDLNLNILGPNNINLKAAGTTVLNVQSGSATVTGNFAVTGTITSGGTTGVANLVLNGGAGNQRSILWKTAGSNRWQFYADTNSEGGSNAGSDLSLQAYSDAGSSLATIYLTIKRSSGRFTYGDGVNFAFGTTTGTQFGTTGGAAGQKLAFWGATPIVQPLLATGAGRTVDDVITTLQSLGLVRQS